MTGRKRPQVNLRTTLPQPTVLQNGAFGYLELSGPKIAVTPEMTSGGDAIARGGYGTVSRVQIRGIVIARKDVPIELGIGLEREEIDRTLERKLREVDVIKGCSSCPFIVHFYGFYVQRISNCVKIHIFMEELALSAQRLIETMLVKEITIPEFVIGRITCSVVNALCFLKEKLQMIHRDVKPSNILIDHDGRVKICDFGISGTLQDSVAQSYTGTQVYTAPEVNETYFGITGYTVKSDIWSLGITICHLATLTRPYAEVADGGNFLILAGAIRDLQPPRLERGRFSDNLVDFVSALLQREEDNRPNFNGVKSLPFFRMHNVPFSCIGSGMGVAIDNGSEYAIDNGLKYAIDRNSERPSVGQWLDNILFDHRDVIEVGEHERTRIARSIDLSTMQMESDLSLSDVVTGSTELDMERPNSRLHYHPEVSYHCTVQPYFALHNHTPGVFNNAPKHRPSLGTLQAADTLHARRFLSDKRRSYRNRSLGPTIASAPSVEQEDYRTPRPSFDSGGYAGKSFDFSSGQIGLTASESNALVKVSADFLRLNGSRQQFKNLLSARKKLGSLPPAYTRIDYSRESLDSHTARALPNHHGPVITVEDTGSQLRINNIKPSVNQNLLETSCSLEKTMVTQCESNGSVTSHNTSSAFKRNNSRYGVPIDSTAVKQVYRVRSERLTNRVRITDRSLYLALIGVILMLVEAEMTAEKLYGVTKDHWASSTLRVIVSCTTAGLLYHIVLYHLNDIVLELVDCGADDWRVVLTYERIIQFIAEFICCGICPLPGTGEMTWTFIEPSLHKDGSSEGRSVQTRSIEVPIDVILSCFMLCRCYLFARFMVLHSKQFQDASTRTLAALNRIQVNFSFVIKTALDQQPVLFLTSFTFIFWIIMSWMFVQCERYGFSGTNSQTILYSNSLWFIAITFMLNGYGDIVPQTNAGRIIAIFVGVVGAIISSILIAVISRNILLSQGQRNVNNFMYDSKLAREHKEAAARVLQHTWHIHKCLQGGEGGNTRLRTYQRKFLRAIHKFRSVKSEMREFAENNNQNNHQMTRLVTDMHTSMQRLINVQEEMRMQIEVLQQSVRNHYHHGVPPLQGLTSSPVVSEHFDNRHNF